jgi:hypothetical protein
VFETDEQRQHMITAYGSTSSSSRASVLRRAACVALLLLPAVATDALAAPSWARAAPAQVEPQSLVKPPGISLEQATNMVRRETGGRVLSAAPTDRGGYEVRVLVDGKRVKNVYVDSDGRIRSRD